MHPNKSEDSDATPKRPSSNEVESSGKDNKEYKTNNRVKTPKRSAFLLLTLFVVIVNCSWAVHHYQLENMPMPLTADQAGKRGFSEESAMEHVKALTKLGPHPIGSDALDLALQYITEASEKIKRMAHWEVNVEVDIFHANSGVNSLVSGLFKGKTLVYADLNHVVLRILPKYSSEAGGNAILVSSHIDTVFSTEGAGDCSSCVAVMLELARGISQWAHGFKNAIIFLFNTGEEEGLNGAHSFITQHPWSSTVRVAIDLEAMGVGGKSGIFQAGPHPWAIQTFAMAAKYPSGQIIAQDLFYSGVIKSATDFQVYKEVAGLSGLDLAYTDNGAVYHTKNDKLKLLKAGSLQHLGENMLAFLLQAATSSHLKAKAMETAEKGDSAVYFDILGTYMVTYRQHFAKMLQNSVIIQSLLIWATSLFIGGYSAGISLALSCLTVVFMWIFSLAFSSIIALTLPFISSTPVPYVASPWLVIGLFAAPALLGALTGQHLGYLILKKYLLHVYSKRNQRLSPPIQAELVAFEAERWLFKAGSVQWLALLVVGNYYMIGSSYLALVWLVSPAFAYGFLEATLSPARLPRPLKIVTLLMGLAVPILISAGVFIGLTLTIIGVVVRFDRNPGSGPEWLGNVLLAIYIAVVICLTFVYLLSYIHFSGAKKSIVLASFFLLGLSVIAVISGIFPPFTEDTARAVNVVHVVETGRYGEKGKPTSYISLFSTTPGRLTKEAEKIEGLTCGKTNVIDFVTFSVKYSCWTFDETGSGWGESDIPIIHVKNNVVENNQRITEVSIDTKVSTRWSLAINTKEIEDFELRDVGNSELIPLGNKSSVDGRHTIQFSGGKNAPTKFDMTLFWVKNSTHKVSEHISEDLLKLRTDVDRLTPKAEQVLMKLPPWCSLFGKSTSPHMLAFLTSLPVVF